MQVLPDTGCELNAVRKDLMSEDQMHDKRFVMITIDGQSKKVYKDQEAIQSSTRRTYDSNDKVIAI